jgi:hypothetical protein
MYFTGERTSQSYFLENPLPNGFPLPCPMNWQIVVTSETMMAIHYGCLQKASIY